MMPVKRVWRIENSERNGPFGCGPSSIFESHNTPQSMGTPEQRAEASRLLKEENYVCSWGSEMLMKLFLLPDADVSLLSKAGFKVKIIDAYEYMILEDGQVIFDRDKADVMEVIEPEVFFNWYRITASQTPK